MSGRSDKSDKRTVPPGKGCLHACFRFIHNPDRGSYCGKTCLNWLLIIIFYVLFLAFWTSLLFLTVNLYTWHLRTFNIPWLHDEDNAMSTPGLGFRPLIMKDQKSPLIWYLWEEGAKRNYKDYSKSIGKFLKDYTKNPHNEECGDLVHPRPYGKEPCYFNTSQLGPCGQPHYGYDRNQPCIYLKVNKVYDWTPDCYKTFDELPEEMPALLKEAIANQTGKNPQQFPHVWISCRGYFPIDDQHMGDIHYYPVPGFQPAYFPYLIQDGYQSPLVAVQFLNADRNMLITIECRAWAKNVMMKPVMIQLMIGRNPELDDNNTNITEDQDEEKEDYMIGLGQTSTITPVTL